MLNNIRPETRKLLEEASHNRKLFKGDMLFLEGKLPSHVYFVLSGKLKLYTTDQQGREQIIHLAAKDDIMGYRAVLGGDSFSCSCSALEDSQIMIVTKEAFLKALDSDPELSHYIIRLLTAELRHAEHHLAGLARKSVRARLAEVLLILADKFGFEKDGETLSVSMTRDEIAGLVGTATETTIRLLQAMKEEGLLATNGRKLRLMDIPGLRRTASDL